MLKRDDTHVKELLSQILEMREQGKTHQSIADHFQFKNKEVVKELLKRQRRKIEKEESGELPKLNRDFSATRPNEKWDTNISLTHSI